MVVVVNLTEKYKQKVWYTEDELNSFKINTRSLAGYLLTNQEVRHNNYVRDIFGLEKYLSVELHNEFILRREQLMNEVLGEAQRGVEADRLAILSEKLSIWAREKARVSALVLEFEQLTTTQM